MKTLAEYLIEYDACTDARQWAEGKSWQEVYDTCDRVDWLLWLFVRSNPDDKRLRVLATARCANAVRSLMTDERSINAVDVALRYGIGDATDGELQVTTRTALAAYAAEADAAAAAAYAAYAAAYAAYAANAAYAALAAAAAAAAAYAARAADAGLTINFADIVRETLPINIWNVV
jgi:hypothetical protein